jgi:hypothetical protein
MFSELQSQMIEPRDVMSKMRDQVDQLPRMSANFSRARRSALSMLDRLVSEFETARNLVNDLDAVLERAAAAG